jgi:hypothetical protein
VSARRSPNTVSSEKEAQDLKAICELSGKTRSEFVREALHGKIFRERLGVLRAVLIPRPREIGWLMRKKSFATFHEGLRR